MKMWRENRRDGEWELSNQEIAEQFIKSKFYNLEYNLSFDRQLVNFICDEQGLNSVWDWDKKKGSIDGSKDILEILDIFYKLTKEQREK